MALILPSGRTIRIDKFIISPSIHSGYLLGHPKKIAKKVREKLRKEIVEACPGPDKVIDNMLIFDDGKPLLPQYRIIANLSSEAVVPSDIEWCSELLVCWFTDNIEMTPAELITTKITDELWQNHAVDFSFDNI